MSEQSKPWTMRYAIRFCPSEPQDHGGSLRSISGGGPCYGNPDKECEGHENQNWAEVVGPEFWRKPYSGGIEPWFMYSEQAEAIVKAMNATPSVPQGDAERAVVEQIALRLDSDPHQWSKRPCETCQEITKVVGRDFGCVAYAKSPLTYSSYGKQAEERLAALHPTHSAEKPAKEKA